MHKTQEIRQEIGNENCRKGIPHNYDIVIGAIANDQIYNNIEDFIAGVITREQFWVLAKFKYPCPLPC